MEWSIVSFSIDLFIVSDANLYEGANMAKFTVNVWDK